MAYLEVYWIRPSLSQDCLTCKALSISSVLQHLWLFQLNYMKSIILPMCLLHPPAQQNNRCLNKKYTSNEQCHQLLSGFLAKAHLLRVSHQSLMIWVIKKWSQGLCTDPLVYALQLRKTSAKRPSDGAVWSVIASNGVP